MDALDKGESEYRTIQDFSRRVDISAAKIHNNRVCDRCISQMYHSAEKEVNQYSADVACIVPEEYSIIYSFIESMKENNFDKIFDKKEVLEELTNEITYHLSWYEESLTIAGGALGSIKQYKESGYHNNDQLKLVITGLANAFQLSINLLTQDKTSNIYRTSPLVYPCRSEISSGTITLFLNNDDHVSPLKNVKILNSPIQEGEVIEVICVKDDYCILEVPEEHIHHCTRVVIKTITKKQDCPADTIYDLDWVEKDSFNGYVYIRLKGLEKKTSYKGLIECDDDYGNIHQYVTREFSLAEKVIENHIRIEGYTVVAHKNVKDCDRDGASVAFRNCFGCLQSESAMKDMSASDWTSQCENYLSCNLIKNNKEDFDGWIIFPNIFMDTTQNVTKHVAEHIRNALSSIQDEQTAGGVIIMYYDSQQHQDFLLKKKLGKEYRDFSNRVLIFHQEMGAILNIRVTESTHPRDISKEFELCTKDADDLATVMDFLIKQDKMTSPKITIATFIAAPNIHSNALNATIFKEKQTLICDGCIPRIITKDHLSEIGNMTKWLQNEFPRFLRSEPEKQVIMKQVIAQISGFIANTSIQVAYPSDDIHQQLVHLQANDEQIQVILDSRKHKVIKAAFGCGKTAVATFQSEFLARIAKEPTTIFYISFDPFSLIDFYMDKHFKNLKLKNVESGLVNLYITNASVIGGEMRLGIIPRVSQILGYIQEQEKITGRRCHIFIDELNSSTMSKGEVELINEKLSFMKDNFITLLLQPFQHQQFEIEGIIFKKKTCVSKTYEDELHMDHLQLKTNMRNSVKISEFLEVTKDIINGEETRYYYAPPTETFVEKETDQKPQTGEPSITIKRNDNSRDGIELSDQCDTNTLTEDANAPDVKKSSKHLPVPMKNALKQLGLCDVKRPSKGIFIERSTEVGHSHQGEKPQLMFIPSTKEIKRFLPKSCLGKEQEKILKIALCLENVKAGDTIICHDEKEFVLIRQALHVAEKDFVTYAHFLENGNKIPSIDEKQEVAKAIDGKRKIVLADSNGCRGYQMHQVVIPLSSTEQLHQHAYLEDAARATAHLLFIVIDCSALSRFGRRKSTIGKVIEKWDSQKMIMVTKPKFSGNSISRYVDNLPSEETLLQETVQM